MATLSEDNDSWNARGIIRRDFRNDKSGPEKVAGPKRRKKDTKRWCKGKEGREHVITSLLRCNHPGICAKNGYHSRYCTKTVCANCGMDSWNLPKELRNPIQTRLAEKWCGEGHLYDWVDDAFMRSIGCERRSIFWENHTNYTYEYHVCVMCGRRSGKRHRTKGDPC